MGRKREELKEEELALHVGQELARRREALNMKQGELGDAVGLGRTSICNIEGGDQRISLSVLYKLCIALGLEPRDILPTVAEVTTEPTKFTMPFEGKLIEVTRSEAKALRKLARKLVKRK